jgi:hypothetical protein
MNYKENLEFVLYLFLGVFDTLTCIGYVAPEEELDCE